MATNADLRKQIREVATTHGFDEFADSIPKPEEVSVRVGFLGEFNAGKSTLINAILGEAFLPAMDRPTTGSIVEIVSTEGVDEPETGILDEDGCFSTIEMYDFREIARGRQEGVAVLRGPSTERLPTGFRFIDTPGISSSIEAHDDLTFGYLPSLDAAVLCLDVNQGMPRSITEFLSSAPVRALIDRIVIVLTKSDTRTDSEATKVIEATRQTFKEHGGAAANVVLTSATAVQDAAKTDGVASFLTLLNETFYRRKRALQQERERKTMIHTASELANHLRTKRESLDLNADDIRAKRQKAEETIEQLEGQKYREELRIKKLKSTMESGLQTCALQFRSQFRAVSREEELENVSVALIDALTTTVSSHLARYERDLQMPNVVGLEAQLESRLRSIMARVDIGSTLVTALLLAGVGAATSAAGNAAEAAGGAAAKEAAKAAGKEAAKNAGKKAMLKKVALSTVAALAEVIEKANPVNHVANTIGGVFKGSAADQELRDIASAIADHVSNQLNLLLEETVFELRRQMRGEYKALEEAENALRKRREDLSQLRSELDADIRKLDEMNS